MRAIEIARRMAQLGETKDALSAYTLVLYGEAEPGELLEAATYTLENDGDYRLAYTTFVGLYNEGCFCEQILPLMTKVFYEPNAKLLKNRYDQNVRRLSKYTYIFRKDFPAFHELPIIFFPYDDHSGYVPFDTRIGEFGGFVNIRDTVVSRNFFADLEKPILATDVYSQYELEYLNDNVRPSEWVGRENHIYLHYTDWMEFCSWLAVLNLQPLLESRKAVFLIEDELSEYPIDFAKRFGVDYSNYAVQPIHIREVNKLIWHTQLSSHNGGDFFNEIMDDHPNILIETSTIFENIEEFIEAVKLDLSNQSPGRRAISRVLQELTQLKDRTDKDILVAYYLMTDHCNKHIDLSARIVPAVFFQPHFRHIVYRLHINPDGNALLLSDEADAVYNSAIFKGFKYIKTFTPLRRPTSSHGGSVRSMFKMAVHPDDEVMKYVEEGLSIVVEDAVSQRVLNRSFLRDPKNRLYRDSTIVRFEDGKLNPKATFSILAAFLDIPYTQSMTYCSLYGERNPKEFEDNVIGFDTAAVYNTYDEYVNDKERKYIEFFLQDAYEHYGYDFHYYDGSPVDIECICEWISGFDTINRYMRKTFYTAYLDALKNTFVKNAKNIVIKYDALEKKANELLEDFMKRTDELRIENSKILLNGLHFINKYGQPLEFTPMIEPDPNLLEQPLYH